MLHLELWKQPQENLVGVKKGICRGLTVRPDKRRDQKLVLSSLSVNGDLCLHLPVLILTISTACVIIMQLSDPLFPHL